MNRRDWGAEDFVEVEARVEKVVDQSETASSRSLSEDSYYDLTLSYTFQGEKYSGVVMTSKLNHRNTWKKMIWVDKTDPVNVAETKPDGSDVKLITTLVVIGWIILVISVLVLLRIIIIRCRESGMLRRISFT